MHSADTAGVIERLFFNRLPYAVREDLTVKLFPNTVYEQGEDLACRFCRLLALLHDIGKLTPAFQSKIVLHINGAVDRLEKNGFLVSDISKAKESPHAIAGQVILESMDMPGEIAGIIGAHHGRSGDGANQLELFASNYFGKGREQRDAWSSLRQRWIAYALTETGFRSVADLPVPDVPTQMLLTGLLIMADWIASNTGYFPCIGVEEKTSDAEQQDRIIYGWKKIDLPEAWTACSDGTPYSVLDMFTERFGFVPNPMQKAFLAHVESAVKPGLLILEAPMGTGKTEAALAAAELLADKFGSGGIFFGLPTQATANGIFGRICEWVKRCAADEPHAVRLLHGMTDLNADYTGLFHGTASDSGDENVIVHEWFEGRKQALLSDFVIATVDQFLMASLQQKHVMLRHLGLAGKIVIIDECHAYDAYMSVYLEQTLRWMGAYGIPVILLSATLPPAKRVAFASAYQRSTRAVSISGNADPLSYPALTWTQGDAVCRQPLAWPVAQNRVAIRRLPESGLTELLREKTEEGGCAAVIVNSVAYAQDLAEKLSAEMPDHRVICFHSRFLASDRALIEADLLGSVGKHSTVEQRKKLIVVGTQVLEQSLDLDFDLMITELCPMDLLLQRAGRLHRHNRERPYLLQQAELWIIEPESPVKSVYDAWILQQTKRFLPETLLLPTDIPRLVSAVYAEPETECVDPLWQNYRTKIQNSESRALKYCIPAKKLGRRYNTLLSDFLTDDVGSSEAAAASVRDGTDTVETLVLCKNKSGNYMLLSGEEEFDPTSTPDEIQAQRIARERLRLPAYFSADHFYETIKSIDKMPPRWNESVWLKHELLLVLDENLEGVLLDRKLCYTRQFGLRVLKQTERSEQDGA